MGAGSVNTGAVKNTHSCPTCSVYSHGDKLSHVYYKLDSDVDDMLIGAAKGQV